MVGRFLLYGSLSLLVGAVLWFAIWQPVQVLPRLRQMPAFTLKDQQGRWLSDSELRGQLTLVGFAYSRCGQSCAATTELMQAVSARRSDGLRLLTISLDVPHDTPAMLKRYAASLGADPERWRFLSGEAAETKALVGGGFALYYEPGTNTAQPVAIRDQRLVLIDDQGLIRAEYSDTALDIQRITRDIALVRREATSTDIVSRSLYATAHLFVCYPH